MAEKKDWVDRSNKSDRQKEESERRRKEQEKREQKRITDKTHGDRPGN